MITGKYIGAGDLRETVTIQGASEGRSVTGAVTTTWPTIFTARAKVEPVRGMEAARLAQAQAMVDYRITIRKHPSNAVAPQQRLVWGSLAMDIQSVIEIGAEGRFVELMCKVRQV